MTARRLAAALALLLAPPLAAQQAQVWAGANDNPNPLINATFVSPTMTYGTEVANSGTTTGLTTSLAFNQVRAFKGAPGPCSLVAQTNNGTNNVSIYQVSPTYALTHVTGSPFTTGAGTQSIAWAPDGGALYVPLAVSGASNTLTFTVSCTGGTVTVTNAGTVALTGFNLLRDAEVVGAGTGTHLCVSGTNSNNVGCFPINGTTRLPGTTAVNTVAVTNVRGLRIAGNGCGWAGVGSAGTVQGIQVTAGSVALTNTAVNPTNPRYGAVSPDGTLAAVGGFGTQFGLFSIAPATCNLTQVTTNNNGIATSLVEYMAFDSSNRLYVADSLANQIRVFQASAGGLSAPLISTTNHATMNAPAGIDVAISTTVPVELQRLSAE